MASSCAHPAPTQGPVHTHLLEELSLSTLDTGLSACMAQVTPVALQVCGMMLLPFSPASLSTC